jgi:TRAP-type uncharacterized transport system substrate-binding protein
MHYVKYIIILIIATFFSFNIYPVQENLITWFLPFYNRSTKELTINTPPYLTSNLVYNQLKFNYIKLVYFFMFNKNTNENIDKYYTFLISNLLKTKGVNIEEIIIKNVINPEKVLKIISNEKNSVGLISSPFLIKEIGKKTDQIKNINSIIISNYNYIFFITNKNLNISSLDQLNNKKVNIGPVNYDSHIFGINLLENLEILYNIKIKKYYDDDDIAIKKLINLEIDGMVFTDLYPSNFLNKIIGNDLNNTLVLLPITKINVELFLKRHQFVNKVSIDLNALPKNYLPVKINDLEYTINRPDLDTFQYPIIFICNKNTEPNISYEIVRGISNNLDLINKSDMTLKNQWNYMTFPDIAQDIFIPTHIGAKIFYNQITITTTKPDYNCMYYIGNKKCNDKDVESATIILGDD